ncbi:MAG: nitrate reductase molybdenum cofactor assembly chaperone [Dehalococcoidales bacterium]|jgi:nitrate reductase delta subunit|nr:nitrate reductase molybdenum cofactor assembly chaperone [Dehalococcoidales bacterium]MDP6632470.1 nitrate reductase molybdenum cofactor assembly chaperone [Dehalococcoidales bacterium]
MLSEESKQLCRVFAEVLEYPGGSVHETAAECLSALDASLPDIADQMRPFVTFIDSQKRGSLEELYSETFDLAPGSTLYIGYHLFGETPKRSSFLVRLEEAYQFLGFESGTELADHLCVMLRFMAVAEDGEFVLPLLEESILPVLDKMAAELQKNKNGYAPAVSSLRLFLRQLSRKLAKVGGLA